MVCRCAGLWIGIGLLVTTPALADSVHMTGGGVAKGKIIEDLPAGVKIKTVAGELFIPRDKITSVAYEKTPEEIYRTAKSLYRDTASDQLKLAQWCARHKLYKHQRVHLARAIKLDPNHAGARRMLGQVKRKGKWVTLAESKRLDGYVRYRGRWVLPLEKELIEQQERTKKESQRWYQKGRTIAALLTHRDPRRREQGYDELNTITDPAAVKPLFDMLTRQDESVRLLLVQALARFTRDQAKQALVRLVVHDRSTRVRQAALNTLEQHKDPMILVWLKRALKPKDRPAMLRAAEALGQIGDLSVVPALINVLVTRHTKTITEPTRRAGIGMAVPIVTGHKVEVEKGTVGIAPQIEYVAPGQPGPDVKRVVVITRRNHEVLEALRRLTGQNFAYSKSAWRGWYDTVKPRAKADAPVGATRVRAPTTSRRTRD